MTAAPDHPAARWPAYEDANIFARILRGELPAHKVYEDEVALAFMDIMPQGPGHTLVVPKAPARTLLDIAPDALAAVMLRVQTVATAVREAFDADGLTLFQFSEAAGGQTVFHLHFHVVPRFAGVALRPHEGNLADGAELAAHADRIAARIAAPL